jgi:hypothetical protein
MVPAEIVRILRTAMMYPNRPGWGSRAGINETKCEEARIQTGED